MARIDTARRLLQVKLVYYGPAVGGKTTNLESLHRIVDPTESVELMTLDTDGDRTLFFDLLPLELGDVGGLKIKVRLFTVPGQVQYNATRRIVLQGADGIVFVADSSPGRVEASCESLRNLRANLEANGIAPGTVPIALQANKRDLPDALPEEELLARLPVDALGEHGRAVLPGIRPASALSGYGVLETFEAALRSAMAQVWRHYQLGRMGISREALGSALQEELSPMRERAPSELPSSPLTGDSGSHGETPDPERVMGMEQLLSESVSQSVELAEALGDQNALSEELKRRVRELETLNELARVFTATVDRRAILRATAVAARAALPEGAASVLLPIEGADGQVTGLGEGALDGIDHDPLLAAGSPPLATSLVKAGRPVACASLEQDLFFGDDELVRQFAPWCTAATAPLRTPDGGTGLVIAYGRDPDVPAGDETTRFLTAIAAQATLALQGADRNDKLLEHQERLEEEVAARTAELRLAHQELVATTHLKDRVLSCVNHELRTPVTKLLSAAQVLERVKPGKSPPPSFLTRLVEQARHLAGLLDQVLSAQALLSPESGSDLEEADHVDLRGTLDAVTFACQERAAAKQVVVHVETPPETLPVAGGAGEVTLVLSQVVDNAVKFTKAGTQVDVGVQRPASDRVRIVVRDRGPGIPASDSERIFTEFDQGSADHLNAKPEGLGLGLAIARRLARRLGGDVGLSDTGSDGAEVWIELPLALESAAIGR